MPSTMLIPLNRKCSNPVNARRAFDANFKFRGIDGKVLRKSDIPDGEITIICGNGAKLSFVK